MEQRNARIMKQRSGGTAGPGGKCFRVALPVSWVKQLGLDGDQRDITLQFDGDSIIMRPRAASSYKTFLRNSQRADHDLLLLRYFNGNTLCTRICVDQTTRTIAVENVSNDPLETAFGVNIEPDWAAYESFLESRCIPRQRDGLTDYLKSLGLTEYHPLNIIRKTEGRMAEDDFHLEITQG